MRGRKGLGGNCCVQSNSDQEMVMSKGLVVIKSTFAKREDAESVAAFLVEKHAAACAQISGRVLSFYQWKNELKQEHEYVLSVKTTSESCQRTVELLKKRHPYELPEIIFSEVQAERAYQEWVEDETQ